MRREGRQLILRNYRGQLHLYSDRAREATGTHDELGGLLPDLVEEFEPLVAIG